jgi:hypothetical protein
MKTMKTILTLFIVVACVYHSKARQNFGFKQDDSLSHDFMYRFFKTNPNKRQLLKPKFNLNEELSVVNVNKFNFNGEAFYSTMPVVKSPGHWKMPVAVVKSDDKMPVKHVEFINPIFSKLQSKLYTPNLNNLSPISSPVPEH